MPVYFEYALKVSLCLAIVFLFYSLLLKRMTYYTWNRCFLLIFSLLSFIVPFIHLDVFMQPQQLENMPLFARIPVIANNKIPLNFVNSYNTFNYGQILLNVYVLVSSILVVRFWLQILSIHKVRSAATLAVEGDVKIYHVSKTVLPFSFLNRIFLNYTQYSENELQDIIDHEMVHVEQKHTFDILLIETICILNWYNPFTWLIKNAVRENLEFIADDVVIRKGGDIKNYQYLLLKVTGNVPSSITSNLKFSSLKNRITMMNKTKTGKLHLLKFALIVPLVTILLLAFREKYEKSPGIVKEQASTTKTYFLTSLTYSIPDKKVEAVVNKEQGECLLKTGEALSLELVYNERARLKNVLEKNGFNEIGSHAITFMIDTTSGNNSFSVEVNINLAKDEITKRKKEVGEGNDEIRHPVGDPGKSIQPARPVIEPSKTNLQKNKGEYELNNKQPVPDKFADAR